MTLSQLLIQYRETHGLSQRQLATQCGVSNGYISMLEKNLNPSTGDPVVPTLPTLKKIASGIGISLDTLFSLVDDMPISLDLIGQSDVEQATSLPKYTHVKIAGRDGTLVEKDLTDADAELLLKMIERLPDAGDDL